MLGRKAAKQLLREVQIRPKLPNLGPGLVEVGKHWPKVGRYRQTLADLGYGQIWVQVDRDTMLSPLIGLCKAIPRPQERIHRTADDIVGPPRLTSAPLHKTPMLQERGGPAKSGHPQARGPPRVPET